MIRTIIAAVLLATTPAMAGVTVAPGDTLSMVQMGTATTGGVIMSDQWGNKWIQVGNETGKVLVTIYDCAGTPKIIGEVPARSLASGNNFSGFKPYLNATERDLAAVYNEAQFEKNCMEEGRRGQACEPNPKRYDCKVVLEPADGGNMIPPAAWKAYEAMHPRK